MQLCASGTIAVAAVGFAFGYPQHSTAARPTSNKRRVPYRTTLEDSLLQSTMANTPTPLPQPASAPTSRLRKRSSLGRTLTSSNNLGDGIRTVGSTPETKVKNDSGYEHENAIGAQSLSQESQQSSGSFAFEFKGSETVNPSWLRRVSTLSSLRSTEAVFTPQPGSPSIAHSNGSTAPILPNFADPNPGTLSRNKLVKRSSSQRVLHGSPAPRSTLRRPATSHQRSATLQRQYLEDEDPIQRPLFHSFSSRKGPSDHHQYDSPQLWRPFFSSQPARLGKDGSSRKPNAHGATNRGESIKGIVPDITELPTLLSATSISTRSSDDAVNGRASTMSGLSRPFSPVGFDNSGAPSTEKRKDDSSIEFDSKPRNSFSLSEMFPSPSPLTWKMPHTGSLRKPKSSVMNTAGRRAVSAPQSMNIRKPTNFARDVHGSGKPRHSQYFLETQTSPSQNRQGQVDVYEGLPASPLPPLNRLSSFEVNLPDSIPSYPASPQTEDSTSPHNISAHSSPSMTSPIAQAMNRNTSHRPSGALSDHASTLLGSDADNSRLLSGDEEDMDSRSSTVYDSTRTGATGSSHSGIKRPPIETIFDESPPPELPSNDKLLALKEILTQDTSTTTHKQHGANGNQSFPKPDRTAVPCKEDECPTPLHDTEETFLSPNIATLPPLELRSSAHVVELMDHDQDDDLWAFDNEGDLHKDQTIIDTPSPAEPRRIALADLPQPSNDPLRRRDSPPTGSVDTHSKSNIFEWSEQAMSDKDIQEGESPRPKTVHGRQGKDIRGSRLSGRRGPSPLHLRSQSVPVPNDIRSHGNSAKVDSWVLGNKGPSEDWDGDFEFEESPRAPMQEVADSDVTRLGVSSGMLVPRAILERQASVHGQFGQVKELTLLVEELKRLQQQASGQGIMNGQSAELWKEAEGIINLATLDDEEQELFPPRSPHSPNFEFDLFDEDSPSVRSRRRSGLSPPKEDRMSIVDDSSVSQSSSRPSQEMSKMETPPPTSRPRKESTAKAKSVLETIHQQRSQYDPALLDAKFAQKKLPFDTTSLKDLVTRAGVVTRALKEIVRRAENAPISPEPPPPAPKDPPFRQMFQQHPLSPTLSKSPRVTSSPKSLKSPKSGTFRGGSIAGNDNEINGHMKMMTVV